MHPNVQWMCCSGKMNCEDRIRRDEDAEPPDLGITTLDLHKGFRMIHNIGITSAFD